MTPRDVALTARLAAERGRRLDLAFSEAAEGLERRDRAFAQELAFGTTRLRGRLDHLIAPHVKRGLDGLQPEVLEVLRLGAYQLLYMRGVPSYASVSESVDLTRSRVGPRATGLVNAVLRRVSDAGEAEPVPGDDSATTLAAWESHPQWMVERWLEVFGPETTREILQANNRRAALFLTPLGVSVDEALALLATAEIEAEPVSGTPSVRLGAGTDPAAALVVVPSAIIQDPAAALVARYADVPAGTKVADLCAAPGGKVLAAWNSPAQTVASDRSEKRIQMVRQNASRTGRSVGLVVADGRRPPLRPVDVVLLDVPCTGTGTLSRHPDARWRLSPADIPALASLQDELLDGAASIVAPGGLLVYSTCSLEPEENGERVAAFLERHTDFSVEPGRVDPARLTDEGYLSVMPGPEGFDGAFAARLRRAA